MDSTDVIREARSMIGTPFHHQGRLPGVGIDCIGIGSVIAKKFGLPVEDSTDYPPETDGEVLHRGLESVCDRVPMDTAKPGDIMEFLRGRGVHHVSILSQLHPAKMIHAFKTMCGGSVVEEVIPDAWARSCVAVWRLRGLS